MVEPLPPESLAFGLKPPYGFLLAPMFALVETFALGLGGPACGEGDGVGIFAFLCGEVGLEIGLEVLVGDDGRDGGPNVLLA